MSREAMPTSPMPSKEGASAFDSDVLITGAGVVGLTLACALEGLGLRCTLVDARPHGAAKADARVLALAYGSQLCLAQLGVWAGLTHTPITSVHVSEQGGLGRTLLQAQDYDQAALGYVANAGALAEALLARLADAAYLSLLPETTLAQPRADAEGVTVSFSGAHAGTHRTRLLVCAEGAVASAGEAAIRQRTYGQCALISEVRGKGAVPGRAFERFTPQGPLALLPWEQGSLPAVPGEQRYAVVHVDSPAAAEKWQQLPETDYLALLQQKLGGRLCLSAGTERLRYPLDLRYRTSPVGQRTVWLGNAAQTLHPVAGQGFNLALRDVWTLAQHIQASDMETLGSPAQLQAYAQARQLDRRGVIELTDGLVRLFSNADPLCRAIRGPALMALDLVPPLRHFLARRLMFGARAWP